MKAGLETRLAGPERRYSKANYFTPGRISTPTAAHLIEGKMRVFGLMAPEPIDELAERASIPRVFASRMTLADSHDPDAQLAAGYRVLVHRWINLVTAQRHTRLWCVTGIWPRCCGGLCTIC